jgi:hypothetical protein
MEHYVGCMVSNDLNDTTPDALSPQGMFGLRVGTYTPDQGVSRQQLEAYAINALMSRSFYYRKGTLWAMCFDWFKDNVRQGYQTKEAGWIREGDMIGVLQKSGDTVDDVEYNQYKNLWQVVSWTLDSETMKVTAELGDFERNTASTLVSKTASTQLTIT